MPDSILLRVVVTFALLATLYMRSKDPVNEGMVSCAIIVLFVAISALRLLIKRTTLDTAPGAVRRSPENPPPKFVYRDLETCRQILSCRPGNKKMDMAAMLKARALPNQRLHTAFGIDNAFTTTDIDWYKRFRAQAESLLQTPPEKWARLAEAARQIVHQHTSPATTSTTTKPTIALTSLVQLLTLKISLQAFFNHPASTFRDDDAAFAAAEINRLWLASKGSPAAPTAPWPHQPSLIATLRDLLPCRNPEDPRRNPLNLLLPAYETTWRVVLRCLLEVRFRGGAATGLRHAPHWRTCLRDFLVAAVAATAPAPRALERVVGTGEGAVSAAAIAREALRLYPPTRRVHRAFPGPTASAAEEKEGLVGDAAVPRGVVRVVAADVEALQRDPRVWGGGGGDRDPRCFWPRRWVGGDGAGGGGGGAGGAEDGGGGKPFLAFGVGQFACPARREFGVMVVALLVGALVEGFGEEEWVVDGTYAREMAGVAPLESGREAYADLRVVRG